MTSINTFQMNVYSEELFDFTEEEYAAVMADAGDEYKGYSEWSQELEQGQIVNTPHGEILINKECAHPACLTTRCEKDVRVGGIAV